MKSLILKFFNLFDSIYNFLILRLKGVKYGENLKINGKIYVCGQGEIDIDDSVTINSCRRSNQIGGDTKTILNTAQNGRIIIGAGSGISNSTIVSRECVTIGKDVKIGGSVKIYDTDFHSVSYFDRIENGDTNVVSKPITIKDGAFIGAFSIILKGVTIGEHSVIGAGSVVTKDIPDHEIWAGNPAKFIKKTDEI